MDTAYTDDSWKVEYSIGEKCLKFSTTDYHAEPLKLSATQLRNMLNILDPVESSISDSLDAHISKNEHIPTLSANKSNTSSSDAHTEQKPNAPFFVVSKKEKCLHIGVPNGWAGIVRLTRKELYHYGKKMGKRAKML